MAFVLRNAPDLAAKHEAYPYQLDAIRALQNLPFAAIFHEQGLGKTKIAVDLALLWLQTDAVETVLVVTKKSLVENWRKEVELHCHLTPHVLSGSRRKNTVALNAPGLLYLANYEVIASNATTFHMFLRTCRVGCILDESQKIKNPEAALTQTFHDLADGFARRIIMTGTPVANRPQDIWAQIKFLDGGEALGLSFDKFKEDMDLLKGPAHTAVYADERQEYAQANVLSERSTDSFAYAGRLATIHSRIARFAIRETKKTAGIQLPEKTIKTHQVDLPAWQWAKYVSYRDELAYEYQNVDGIAAFDSAEGILKRLLRLVQCASNPALIDDSYEADPGKYPVLMDLCREFTSDSKVIVWTNFVENVEWLAFRLTAFSPVRVHGGLSMQERNAAIESFLHSKASILVATPGAAKEGLTLTVANHAIFYDRSFSLDDYLQAQDRIHRISQHRRCFVHNIIANDTIDEWIDVLLSAKYLAAQMAQGDVDREVFEKFYRTDVSEMLGEVLSAGDGLQRKAQVKVEPRGTR